ncbi:MAG: ABC transporter transmembrane domain-containing protein [Kiritimatiellia bacterium]
MQMPPQDQSSPRFLEWAYQSSSPLKTLWRWADFSLGRLFWILIIFTVKNAATWLMPVTISLLIDKVVHPDAVSPSKVVLILGALILALLGNVPFHTYYVSMVSKITRKLERRLRQALVIRLQQLSIPYHDNTESGRLQAKVLRDVEQVQGVFQQMTDLGLSTAVSVLFTLGIILSREPLMLGVYLVMVPVVLGLRQIFHRKIRRENRVFREKIEEMNSQVTQMIEMIPVSRAHGIEESSTEKVDHQLAEVSDQGRRLDRINGIFQSSAWVSFQLGNLSLLLICVWLAYQGTLSVGEVILFEQLFKQILMSLSNLLNVYPQLAKGIESVRSIGEVLECPDLEHNQGKTEVSGFSSASRFAICPMVSSHHTELPLYFCR